MSKRSWLLLSYMFHLIARPISASTENLADRTVYLDDAVYFRTAPTAFVKVGFLSVEETHPPWSNCSAGGVVDYSRLKLNETLDAVVSTHETETPASATWAATFSKHNIGH